MLHGTGIFPYYFTIEILPFHVGKYTSPMEHMGQKKPKGPQRETFRNPQISPWIHQKLNGTLSQRTPIRKLRSSY